MHLAHSILTLTAASVLSTFDLVRKVDENGREIEPKREYTKSSMIRQVQDPFSVLASCVFNVTYSQPLNFPCVIKPRSHYTVELIQTFSGLELVE